MKPYCLTFFLFITLGTAFGQTQTVGVSVYEQDTYEGYTLFSPLAVNSTYLIDNCGHLIKSWEHRHNPAFSSLLLEDGTILRAGKPVDPNDSNNLTGGFLELISWDNDLLWSYEFNRDTVLQHHDVIRTESGSILFLAWERNTPEEQVTLGRDANDIVFPFLWTEVVFEIEPIGSDDIEIIWEWHAKDHLIQDLNDQANNFGGVKDNIGKIDINYVGPSSWAGPDWWHANAIDYNADLDQVMINARNNNELWIIDHSTSIAEAASSMGGNSGRGGDLLFRWGNPAAYQKGTIDDLQMFGSHGTYWIPEGLPNAGKIMFFNNGHDRPEGFYSTIEMVSTEVDADGNYQLNQASHYLPIESELVYQATDPENFLAPYLSNAQQLPNGNVLINEGTKGHLFEIDQDGVIVWDYINPVGDFEIAAQFSNPFRNTIFRAYKYAPDYPAFSGKDLEPMEELEGYTEVSVCDPLSSSPADILQDWNVYMDYVAGRLVIDIKDSPIVFVEVFNVHGTKLIEERIDGGVEQYIPVSVLVRGVYFARVSNESGASQSYTFIK